MNELQTSQMGLFDPPSTPKSSLQATVKPGRKKNTATRAAADVLKNIPHKQKKAVTRPPAGRKKVLPPPSRPRFTSGLVPEGDVRLTANIKEEIHLQLKIVAAQRRTTIGELIEELVENYLESPYGGTK